MLTSRHVGPIATDYLDIQIARGDETIEVDVNVADPASFTQAAVEALDRAIDEIDHREAAARAAFAAVMDDDKSEPVQFWRFHHDEVEGLGDLARETFVASLKLVRAGFYPDETSDSASYVVLDFVVRGPQTDQLLVAKFRHDGSLRAIAWES